VVTLTASATGYPRPQLATAWQINKMLWRDVVAEVTLLMLKGKSLPHEPGIVDLTPELERHWKVFSEKPAGLPPDREVEHAIDLLPGHSLPCRGIYRMPEAELKELRKQLDELLAAGSSGHLCLPMGHRQEERW
jgi:hypothetical protein